jgi:hypothetical protein
VRLHFDEMFDGSSGMRKEDVTINDKTVLKEFDIVQAAGRTRKALVKDFTGISPNAAGDIVIDITPSKNSPDRNAKINGIEILPMPEGDVSGM